MIVNYKVVRMNRVRMLVGVTMGFRALTAPMFRQKRHHTKNDMAPAGAAKRIWAVPSVDCLL